MKQYHVIRDTPLKFHKFFWCFTLPFGLVLTLISFFNPDSDFYISVSNIFGIIDLAYIFSDIALRVIIVVGFFSWKSSSWYGVMIFLSLHTVYDLYVTLLHLAFLPEESSYVIGQLLGYLIYAVLVCIYYIKRRPLFFSSAPIDLIQTEPFEAKIPPEQKTRQHNTSAPADIDVREWAQMAEGILEKRKMQKPEPEAQPAPAAKKEAAPPKQQPRRRISAVAVVGIIGGIIAAVLIGAVVYDIGYRNGEDAAAQAYEVESAETREEANNDEYFTNPTIEPNQSLYLLAQEALASGEAMTMLISDGYSYLENLESNASHAYNIGFANDYYHGYFYGYTDAFYAAVKLFGENAAQAYEANPADSTTGENKPSLYDFVHQHDIVGVWKLAGAVTGGIEVTGEQMEEILGEIRFAFNADGTCVLTMGDIVGTGNWTADGNTIAYETDGVWATGTLNGDTFTTEAEGSELIFTRQ